LPFGAITSFGYATIFVVVFVFYILASLELIAEEIEDPFGTDANDLPTDNLATTIQGNLKELF
jgi:putative membrane protein